MEHRQEHLVDTGKAPAALLSSGASDFQSILQRCNMQKSLLPLPETPRQRPPHQVAELLRCC